MVRGQQLGGGGPIPVDRQTPCISQVERAFAEQLIAAYERGGGSLSQSAIDGPPPKLTIFPLAGRLWRDLFVFNYVDIDPGPGFMDWDCTNFTYNGHQGNDTDIRSFGEQIIGVPVYAAQDGVVVATHDGEPDMNTEWAGQPANFVIIDHGFGREGWYWHLKTNSVAVIVGQTVSAGEQIGQCASSGVSTGPHLHFELRDAGQTFEPFAGPCRPGDSGWVRQPLLDRSMYLHDFGITHRNINAAGPWPFAWPTTGQIALSDAVIRVWWYGTALPAGSQWEVRFRRPNGSIVPGSLPQSFGNPFWRWYNWWWTYSIDDMHSITGTWHVLLSINGDLVLEAPIEVVTTRSPGFNRPPEPITVSFHPSKPQPGEVVSCLVNTSLTLDDLDYDIVRFEYVWTVNGDEVRRITSAAHSDLLPRHFATENAEVECTVTPSDGTASGQGDAVSVIVRTFVIPAVSARGILVMALATITAGTLVMRARRRGLRPTSR